MISKDMFDKKRKETKISLLASLFVTISFYALGSIGVTYIACPAGYLNPWQYFASCSLFYGMIYSAIFCAAYVISWNAATHILKNKDN